MDSARDRMTACVWSAECEEHLLIGLSGVVEGNTGRRCPLYHSKDFVRHILLFTLLVSG
jgi:hypothetical protein